MKSTTITTIAKTIGIAIILTCGFLAIANEAGAQTTTADSVKHCAGIKADKTPCRSVIIGKTGYCNAHNPEAIRCGAKTSKGEPCKMVVKKQGEACRFHTSTK